MFALPTPVTTTSVRLRVNISARLERGKMIAFIGESGCGKSTTLALLRGVLTADSGDLWCDNIPMPNGLSHISNHCTLIPQEPEIFEGSVLFNITLGMEANDESIKKAIQLAHFETVLARLPRGLETNLAEKGVNLSGGEKQRLALARGLFFVEESESEIILLDEPTSSVDPGNEWLIYKAIKERYHNSCVISSLH